MRAFYLRDDQKHNWTCCSVHAFPFSGNSHGVNQYYIHWAPGQRDVIGGSRSRARNTKHGLYSAYDGNQLSLGNFRQSSVRSQGFETVWGTSWQGKNCTSRLLCPFSCGDAPFRKNFVGFKTGQFSCSICLGVYETNGVRHAIHWTVRFAAQIFGSLGLSCYPYDLLDICSLSLDHSKLLLGIKLRHRRSGLLHVHNPVFTFCFYPCDNSLTQTYTSCSSEPFHFQIYY